MRGRTIPTDSSAPWNLGGTVVPKLFMALVIIAQGAEGGICECVMFIKEFMLKIVRRGSLAEYKCIRALKKCCSTVWHSMVRPQVADGFEDLQIWRMAANILDTQSRTADKGWYSSLGDGRGANNSSP